MECIGVRLNEHDAKRYEHSDRISDRRKALFPPSVVDDDNNSDSDLGPMSPLSDVSACDLDLPQNTAPPDRTIRDYIIFAETSASKTSQENSPMQSNNSSASLVCYETPIKETPTKDLKTPHESSSTTVKVPRMPRKNNLDTSCNDLDVDVDGNSPESILNKSAKLDASCTKNSRVRTALFPESNLTLPVRSFYSASDDSRHERPLRNSLAEAKPAAHKSKPAPSYLCGGRRVKTKRRFGQINAGVRHGVRKPKQKKISRTKLLQTALNIIENSPLTPYLEGNVCENLPENIIPDPKTNRGFLQGVEEEEEEDVVQPDPNKKFFKSTRMRGIVTVNKNIKLQVSKGKMHLIENDRIKRQRKQNRIDLDASDLTVCEGDRLAASKVNIADIITMLEDDKENHQQVNNSVAVTTVNDRKRKHSDQASLEGVELLLSPTSQMCDMASGLAIHSPKRAKLNISKILDGTSTTEDTTDNVFHKTSAVKETVKLFPIFCSSSKSQMKPSVKTGKTSDPKQWKPLPRDQMLLDAGQKRFGTTQCTECELIYNMGDPNDEIMHLSYHNDRHILRFNGWKHENLVATNKGDRIIKICPGDPKVWWKKVNDLMEVVNKDLGFCDFDVNIEKSVVFLYIKQKHIGGCLVAQPKSHAYRMLPNSGGVDVCSEESYPVKCGVSRIWVARGHRKQGIATALLNFLRMNFTSGYILRNEDIALSSPTEMGKTFATKYFKTANYLIYMS